MNGRLIRSPMYEKNYGTLIADQRWEPAGFKLRHGLKDVRLALAAAEEKTTPMPVGEPDPGSVPVRDVARLGRYRLGCVGQGDGGKRGGLQA